MARSWASLSVDGEDRETPDWASPFTIRSVVFELTVSSAVERFKFFTERLSVFSRMSALVDDVL
jgi:hypothetical protein